MAESYKDRARKRGKQRQEKNTITLDLGENTLRVLPTPKGHKTPEVYYEFYIHSDVGPQKVYLRCNKEVGDEDNPKRKCWLCDSKIPKLIKSGKEARASKLERQLRMCVQASKVDEEGHFSKPKLWYPSKKIGDSLLTQILGSKKRDYVNAKKGYNFTIDRTGTSFKDTRYGPIIPDDDPTKVPSSIIDSLKPFSELKSIPVYNEDKQKAAYAGEDLSQFSDSDSKKRSRDEDDDDDDEDLDEDVDDVLDDDDEDDEPKKKKGKKSKKSDDDDEEEDEDEEEEDSDDDDDEEEDEPKKKKSKKKSKKSDDDDDEDEEEDDDSDDDDDEDDDDEEEERPKKKKKKKSRDDDDDED